VELAARYIQGINLGIHTFVRIVPDVSNNHSLQHLGLGGSDQITFGGYPVGPLGGSMGSLFKGLNNSSDFNVDSSDFAGSITINKPDQYASQAEFEQAILKGYISMPSNLGAYSILGGNPSLAGQVISNNVSSDLLLKAGVSKGEIKSIYGTFPNQKFGPYAPGVGIGLPDQKLNSFLDNLSALQLGLQSLLNYLKAKD
jgi:hypothetical protein